VNDFSPPVQRDRGAFYFCYKVEASVNDPAGQIILGVWWGLEKVMGELCPRCSLRALTIYYDEETDLELGGRCEECGYKGFFMRGKLVQVAAI
jgi:DNA-directed RNA polymerase subunit RPC12/RpoP